MDEFIYNSRDLRLICCSEDIPRFGQIIVGDPNNKNRGIDIGDWSVYSLTKCSILLKDVIRANDIDGWYDFLEKDEKGRTKTDQFGQWFIRREYDTIRLVYSGKNKKFQKYSINNVL